MEVYLGGCRGIIKPVDMHGAEIKAGDKLTWDFGDPYYDGKHERWMKEPVFIVEHHKDGKGLCATGINKDLYLHDFRFKYCEKVANQ